MVPRPSRRRHGAQRVDGARRHVHHRRPGRSASRCPRASSTSRCRSPTARSPPTTSCRTRSTLAGVQGDHALVNGMPQPYVDVADRKYRLRILNASNFRNYELELSNGQAMTQIGTESGLLPAPVTKQRILLSPAERADIVIDFNGLHRPADRPAQHARDRRAVRARPVPGDRATRSTPARCPRPCARRRTSASRSSHGSSTSTASRTSGRSTARSSTMERIDAQPVLGTTERWILRNNRSADHTVHVHSVDQQLITPQRAAAHARRADQGVVEHRRRAAGRGEDEVQRPHGPLRLPLPRARARGPRHDGPVRGRGRSAPPADPGVRAPEVGHAAAASRSCRHSVPCDNASANSQHGAPLAYPARAGRRCRSPSSSRFGTADPEQAVSVGYRPH